MSEPDVIPEDLLRSALALASVGIPVFPCVPDAKRPLTQHGLYDASTDPARIHAWWRHWPDANIAVPTGTGAFDVLDVDIRGTQSGYPALDRLNRADLLAGCTRIVSTPSGGMHAYFLGSDQASGRIGEQYLDFKAVGGYVLVPPSVIDGHAYEVVIEFPSAGARLDWPAVREALAPAPPVASPPRPVTRTTPLKIEPLAFWVSRLPEGQRNSGTFWAACRAVESGYRDLRPILDAAVSAGLPFHEAARTVGSAVRTVKQAAPSRGPSPPAPARRPRSGP